MDQGLLKLIWHICRSHNWTELNWTGIMQFLGHGRGISRYVQCSWNKIISKQPNK
jgi:hypothetical protein